MIRFFKSAQPAILFSIPVILLLLWIQALVKPPETIFYPLLLPVPGWLAQLLAVIFISFEAIYFNQILNRHVVLHRNSYLPALLYALLMSFSSEVLVLHPVILANIFLLRSFDKIFSLFKNDSPVSSLFDSFFLLAVACIMERSFLVFALLLFIILRLIRPFSWREWAIAVVGFLVPVFFVCVYLFCSGLLADAFRNLAGHLRPAYPLIKGKFSQPAILFFILTTAILFLSFMKLGKNFYKNIVKTRICQQAFLIYCPIAALAFFLQKAITITGLTVFVIPLAVFLSYFFVAAKKKWFAELLLWLMIILIAWNHF